MPAKEHIRLETQPIRITAEVKRRLSQMAAERAETVAEFLRRELAAIAFRDNAAPTASLAESTLLQRGLDAIAVELRTQSERLTSALDELHSDSARLDAAFDDRHSEAMDAMRRSIELVLRRLASDSESNFTRRQVGEMLQVIFFGKDQEERP